MTDVSGLTLHEMTNAQCYILTGGSCLCKTSFPNLDLPSTSVSILRKAQKTLCVANIQSKRKVSKIIFLKQSALYFAGLWTLT